MPERSPEHVCVYGLGWGDEGKGKVVDLLTPAFDVVVRYNGGANAGHTVCVGQEAFALHLLPAGILHPGRLAVIGPGVVVDPATLLEEIDQLTARGFDVVDRLRISDRAHIVLAHHRAEDMLSEQTAVTGPRIGTTARGIGPCYADKMRRTSAVRFADLLHDPELPARVERIVSRRAAQFRAEYANDGQLDPARVRADLEVARRRLAPLVCDTVTLLHERMDNGAKLLFEGANGVLLDVDLGTYPFVTSSATGPAGVGGGAGVAPSRVTRRIGISKAYATRVGEGPFVTELRDADGDRIRERGREYGTTTGRPRRCGWLDLVALRFAARVTDVTDIALMHLDTLSGFDHISVCVAYEVNGRRITTVPADSRALEAAAPVLERLPGWSEDLRDVRRFDDLPRATRNYVRRIEELCGAPVSILSVGPDRAETIFREVTSHGAPASAASTG
jgi:adenylosuccinate synthase